MTEILTSRNLSKQFGSTQALRDVSLSIYKGERVAILGANGAGKSTLMKVFSGATFPDTGEMTLDNQPYLPKNPNEAIKKGVSTVYQEPFFFPHLSVIENLLIGNEEHLKTGFINVKNMTDRAMYLIEAVALNPDILRKRMDSLSLAEQQLILIARAVGFNAKLLILDEPTSILTDTEANRLFKIVNNLASAGTAICYITHRFDELDKVADRFVIMKDGEITGELMQPNKFAILELMGTAESDTIKNLKSKKSDDENLSQEQETNLISVEGLSSTGKFSDISFSIKSGQIVSLYGLIGSGRTEVAKAIFGELPIDAGKIFYKNKLFKAKSAKNSLDAGISYLPEDRKTQGILKFLTIRENITISIITRLNVIGLIKRKLEQKTSFEAVKKYSIKVGNIEDSITSLSGGNQQKALLARTLASDPDLLLLDEPTRGIDVKTKSEIHEMIVEIAKSGKAVLLITSELPELMDLSDVVHVLRRGQIVKTYQRGDFTEKNILSEATALSL